MEIKRIGKDSWSESPYSILCSKRELLEIYQKGLDVLKAKVNHAGRYNIIDKDANKEYLIILSKAELETLQDGLCCDSSGELRQLIRKLDVEIETTEETDS
jgi:hypothetical protein